ncbi:MAG TPA: hypothetical protein QGF52_01335 [Nitrososphaerales archaeon]|jgi:hypothetical protein|nr:hypothetical protein [Nitrososphaerales archaeon]|tara:strand:- start:7059 stop:8678 length:1620 start_codon:yes stop_codon:yes gene_type:complete
MPSKPILISHFNYSLKSQLHLSKNAELAAIIGLALSRRKKKGFLRNTEEKIKYVSRFEYPFYIYKRHEKVIILSPSLLGENILNIISTIDTHKFLGEIHRTSKSKRHYIEFLTENINLFEKNRKINQISLDGIMINNDLSSFLIKEAKKEKVVEKTINKNKIFLLEEEKTEIILDRFDDIQKKVQTDLDNLEFVADVINSELDRHILKNDIEINMIEEQADIKISEVLPSIKRHNREIEKEKISAIRQFEKISKKKLSDLSRLKNKVENELRRHRQQEARFNREKQKKKDKQDKYGEQFWSKELAKCKKEIVKLETSFKRCEDDINKQRVKSSEHIDRIRNLYLEKMNIERQKIIKIENRRDTIIRTLKTNQRRLDELTDKITNDMVKQIEMKKLEIEKIEDHLISWKIDDNMVIFAPFYLTRYSSEKEVRYDVIVPQQVNIEKNTISNVGRKLVGLENNLADNLKPFSIDLSEMVIQDILEKLSKNVKFSSEVDEEACNMNIFELEGFSNMMLDGLDELVGKDLLNRNEATKIKGYCC